MAEKFIKVKKDDKVIEIHPLALEDHKSLGWKVVGEEAAAEGVAAVASGDDKTKKAGNVRKRVTKAKAEEGNTEA